MAGLPPRHPQATAQRLELAARCGADCNRPAMDLSNLLSDGEALQTLVGELFRPFEALHADQVLALHVPSSQSRGEEQVDPANHRLTSAIAGAIAASKQLAYGEVTVSGEVQEKQKKRTRDGTTVTIETKCQKVVEVQCASGLKVQWKKKAIGAAKRVLLVIDWINEVDSVFAARDAITKQGSDVVGVSFVVATNASLLQSLKTAQVAFSCSWTPANGVNLNTSVKSDSKACNVQVDAVNGQSSRKRQRTEETDLDPSVQVYLTHRTAEYQANQPSEDRSVNIVKASDHGVQINAVFDGHGGSRAVEHLRKSLCQRILESVSSKKSSEEVSNIVKSAFAHCDEELKQTLLALPPNVRMSKGYCNAGSCAVVALFISSVLYVANVGDCAAVLGKVSQETRGLQSVEVSVDHSCNNPDEARLVVERSHDRNAIRMSKDDQATGAGIVGVKRVAGSLAMTRAFGDFYLKSPELSSAPFKSKVPYITSEPSITTIYMDGSEKYLILASDGLWDVMTPQEAVHIVDKFDSSQSLFFSTASAALIHAALEKIAHRDGLMIHELMAMPQGPVRRRFHDDITCTVVYIDHLQGTLSTTPTTKSPKENTPEA